MRDFVSDAWINRSSTGHRRRDRHAGFTLLEVLVALVIVALSVAAVLHSASVASRAAQGLEERFFARWVGLDALTELKLAPEYPSIGIRTGQRQLGLRAWNWEARISGTPEPKMRRVEMIVSNDRQQQVASIVAYIGDRLGDSGEE